MFAPFILIVAEIQALLWLGTLVGLMIAVIRSGSVNPEVEERARMRSLSWPATDMFKVISHQLTTPQLTTV